MAKPVMIVKPGSLNSKDKEKLTKNGYIVVEHPFPGDVKIITFAGEADMDIIMQAFAKGLDSCPNSNAHHQVGQHLARLIASSEKVEQPARV